MRGKDEDGNQVDQYTVFERWLADKLTYLDWKLCFILKPEDFEFIHDKSVIKDDSEYTQETLNEQVKRALPKKQRWTAYV